MQVMKFQFMLCLTMATSVSTVSSQEFIVTDLNDKYKKEVYNDILSFSIPTLTTESVKLRFKNKYKDYDLLKTFGTKGAEYDFKKQEINKIDKNARLWGIPKSLYQLIVYDYFAIIVDKPLGNTYGKLKKQFQVEEYTEDNEEYGITKACDRLIKDKEIQDIFWEVNDHATQLYEQFAGDLAKITNYLLENFGSKINQNGAQSVRPLDMCNILMGYNNARMNTLVGLTGNDQDISTWKTPNDYNEEKRKKLKNCVTNLILSENSNPDYVIYRGDCYRGNSKQLNPEIAYRKSLCFSDGLFSGFIFDPGASAFAISDKRSNFKLYVLALNRIKLLNGEYPIFIPPINPLASAAGNGELFHPRTQVVQAVKHGDMLDGDVLSIQSCCGKIKAGYLLTQTPELFMNKNPQILEEQIKNFGFVYLATGEGEFDKDDAMKINNLISNIKEVDTDGKILF